MNIFEFVRYQNAKIHAKHLHEKNKTTLPKTCINNNFEFVTYQNAKVHAEHPVWEKQTLEKICVLSISLLLTYQNTETHAKHSSWRNRKTLTKKCTLRFFIAC